MRSLLSLLTLGVVLGLATAAGPGPRQSGKGAKKHPGVHGVVLEVKKDKDKDSGLITLKIHRKKGAPEGNTADKTFKVTPETKFRKVSGAKGAREVSPATFADLHEGEHAVIRHQDDVAREVTIVVRKKKDQ